MIGGIRRSISRKGDPMGRRARMGLSIALLAACDRGGSEGAGGRGADPRPSVLEWIERAREASEAADRAAIAEAPAAAIADGEGRLLVQIVDALGALGPDAKAAAPALARLLAHEDPWVRVAAMETLGGIGEAAVPALLEAFEKGSPSVRVRAGIVLAEMGERAQPAVPALERALRDPSPAIRARAAEILARISGSRGGPKAEGQAPSVAPCLSASEKAPAPSAGWPRFRGPGRDGIGPEMGLLSEWPEGGPPLLWEREGLGRGYSSVSIASGRLFTMGDRAEGGAESQVLIAIDLATREDLWAARVGPPHADGGPRSTPTIDGDRAYALGTDGDLVCVRTETGEPIWRRNLVADFGGSMMSLWKYSESPLVDGERLVCTPGGKDATVVALDKRTGSTIWTCAVPPLGEKGRDGAGYASIVAAEIAGVRQYVQVIGRGAVGIEAETGRFLWGYNRIATDVANIPSAVVAGDCVFLTASYGTGSALLRIHREEEAFLAEEVRFFGPDIFQNHHGGVVRIGRHLYGGHGQNAGAPACIDLETGRLAWKANPPARGSAAVIYADRTLIFRYDRGPVILVDADPEAFRILGRFVPERLGDGPAWAHPAICDGRLYLRHGDRLSCYDLRARRSARREASRGRRARRSRPLSSGRRPRPRTGPASAGRRGRGSGASSSGASSACPSMAPAMARTAGLGWQTPWPGSGPRISR